MGSRAATPPRIRTRGAPHPSWSDASRGAPQRGLRAAPHRLGARARPLHRLRRAQALRPQPPRPAASRHPRDGPLRAPSPRRPVAHRREEAGPYPRGRRQAHRARLRRDALRAAAPPVAGPRVPACRRRGPQPLCVRCRPARRARPQLRRPSSSRRSPRSAAVACACAACSRTTRRPTPSPATSAAWPPRPAWHCGTPGPTARRRNGMRAGLLLKVDTRPPIVAALVGQRCGFVGARGRRPTMQQHIATAQSSGRRKPQHSPSASTSTTATSRSACSTRKHGSCANSASAPRPSC